MVSQIQKLKKLVAVKGGSRRPYTASNKAAAAALADGLELIRLREKIDAEIDRCRKVLTAFAASFGGAPRRKVVLSAGGVQAEVKFGPTKGAA